MEGVGLEPPRGRERASWQQFARIVEQTPAALGPGRFADRDLGLDR